MGLKNDIRGDGNFSAGRDINVLGFDVEGKKFIFSPTIMAEIIDAIYTEDDDAKVLDDFYKPDIGQKNQLNGISEDFFDEVIAECYEEFSKIDGFLKSPDNLKYQKKYAAIVKEIKGTLHNEISKGKTLQDMLPSLLNYAKEKNPSFDSEKGYWLQVFAYYMYVNCDIGKKK